SLYALLGLSLLAISSQANADEVTFSGATATFFETFRPPSQMIDGIIHTGDNGWSIYRDNGPGRHARLRAHGVPGDQARALRDPRHRRPAQLPAEAGRHPDPIRRPAAPALGHRRRHV